MNKAKKRQIDTNDKGRIWLTVNNLCDRYGVSISTIHRWTRDGQLPPPTVISGSLRWHKDAIDNHDAALLTDA